MLLAPLLALGALPLGTPVPEIAITEGLSLQVPGSSRSMLRTDPVAEQIAAGKWTFPSAGSSLGGRSWEPVKAGEDGRFTGPFAGSGYLAAQVVWEKDEVMLLEAQGCSMVYVNGVPRVGDVYGFGYSSLPVPLRAGKNELVFALGRGFLKASLVPPPSPLSLDIRDATTPDVVKGEGGRSLAALVIRNGSGDWQEGLMLEARALPSGKAVRTPVPAILPYAVHKAGFGLELPRSPAGQEVEVEVKLRKGRTLLDTQTLRLRVREASQAHKITFRSKIDGSVQYYALLPSKKKGPGQALFLSLHGASVEAIGQAEAYGAKSWGHVVAPTNRRPFGFNWEDIGRKDAMEVLELARQKLQTDPRRTFLTGHSMGGHGSWHLAVHYPDQFAGTAPAAGWVSYWSYAGGARYDLNDPLQAALRQASNPSDTLQFIRNLQHMAVFILHGNADETVPVREARTMREALQPWHNDLHWHEEEGQGHWYDTDPEPGANCMDYRPIYDLFARRLIPLSHSVHSLDFTTASPRVNGKMHWAEVLIQTDPFTLSRIQAERSLGLRTIKATTQGIRRLRLDLSAFPGDDPVTLTLDEASVTVPLKDLAAGRLAELERRGGGWALAAPLSAEALAAHGTWSFKDVLDHGVVFVVGTGGSEEENRWALDKARYDAETFWYIGNGSVQIVRDRDFQPEAWRGRNVLLYGHSQMNSQWEALLEGSDVKALRGSVAMGRMRDAGSFAVLASAPKPGEPHLLVGAIAGTDRAGMEKATRLPIFTAGAGVGASLVVPSASPQ